MVKEVTMSVMCVEDKRKSVPSRAETVLHNTTRERHTITELNNSQYFKRHSVDVQQFEFLGSNLEQSMF